AGVGCGLVAAACGGPLWIAHVRPSRSFFSIRMSRKRFIRPISILHGLSVSAIHIHTFRLPADERLIMPVIVRAGKLEQAADADLLAIAQRLAHRLTVDAEHCAVIVDDAHMGDLVSDEYLRPRHPAVPVADVGEPNLLMGLGVLLIDLR